MYRFGSYACGKRWPIACTRILFNGEVHSRCRALIDDYGAMEGVTRSILLLALRQ